MEQPDPARPRLNLFAFPSLTTLLFALIVGVILVAILAGLRQNPACLGPILLVGMTLLPLRGLLRQPEKQCPRQVHLWGPPRSEEPLPEAWEHELAEAAAALGVTPPPRLLVASRSIGPDTLGTWRRRYVVIGRPEADRLAGLDADVRRTLWLHEAAHFANGDQWKVGLARSLLQTGIYFMGWSALFFLGMVLMALLYGPVIFAPGYLDTLPLDPTAHDLLVQFWPDPDELASMIEISQQVNPGLVALYTLYAHLPFVLSGLALLPSVWRRLVQVREFYADARLAAHRGDAEQARRSLARIAAALTPWASADRPRWRAVLDGLRRRLASLLSYHPSWAERFACLRDPLRVFGDWKWAGLIAGLTVLLLDLILVGPFTLSYLAAGPAHFAALSGFLILALWLLPGVCRGFAAPGQMARPLLLALLLFMGLRVGWLLFNTALSLLLLLIAPSQAAALLTDMVRFGSKVFVRAPIPDLPQDPVALVLMSLGGSWAFAALVLAALLIGLLLILFLFRRLLTWYAYPAGRRLLRVAWLAILVVALGLGFLILPLPTALIQGDPTYLLRPFPLLAAALALLTALAFGGWFLYADRQYGRRCPACRSPVPGPFTLAKTCPACGETLHPWLLADD